MADGAPFAAVSGGLIVRVRLTPKAARDAIGGTAKDARGITALKATVTAPPEGGKANKALIGMLAKSWRVAKTSISVKSGLTNRQKTLLVEGDTEMLMNKLRKWMENNKWLKRKSSTARRSPPGSGKKSPHAWRR